MRPRLSLAASLLLLALLAACASLTIKNNDPLQPDQLAPQGSEMISTDGYRFADLVQNSPPDDLLLLVSMSGGGKRSAAFSFGALQGLDAMKVETAWGPRSLADEIDIITSVSGGSFPAAYWALHHQEGFKTFPDAFLYQDIDSYIFGIYLMPWKWGWLVDPYVGTNDYMEQVYDRLMFQGASYRDLMQRGKPVVVLGATDLAYGAPFGFTQQYFDLICSDLLSFPVARAVAASNGFPGLFSPITLDNYTQDCKGRLPGWYSELTPEQRRDPFAVYYPLVQVVERYTNLAKTRYVHLMDGGIADNLALRSMLEYMVLIAGSSTQAAANRLTDYRRIVVLSLDGQSAQDVAVAQHRAVGGLFTLFGLVSGAQIDRYNVETLRLMHNQMPLLAESLRRARCATAREINGHSCEDVEATFIHIALSSLPPGPEADRLRAIPTGLTIDKPDVDALVEAGRAMVMQSPALNEVLDGY